MKKLFVILSLFLLIGATAFTSDKKVVTVVSIEKYTDYAKALKVSQLLRYAPPCQVDSYHDYWIVNNSDGSATATCFELVCTPTCWPSATGTYYSQCGYCPWIGN